MGEIQKEKGQDSSTDYAELGETFFSFNPPPDITISAFAGGSPCFPWQGEPEGWKGKDNEYRNVVV